MTGGNDPRIQMVSTYRPPLPRGFGRKRRWRRWLLLVLLVVGAIAAGLHYGLDWLARDPRLPRLRSVADYHPAAVTRIVAATGEPIGEVVGVRRTVVPATAIPDSVRDAVVRAVEPAFLTRPPLTRADLGRALVRYVKGDAEPPSITLALARSLAVDLPDRGILRFVKEWSVALQLERKLSRADILDLYLNDVRFASDRFGVEEGARAWIGRSAAKLTDDDAAELAAHLNSDAVPPHAAPTYPLAPEYGASVARLLDARYDDDALDRLGAVVATPCDLSLTRAVGEAIAHQHLSREGLHAAVVVEAAGSHEVLALVGGADDDGTRGTARPLGAMRAPLVVAAALATQKVTAASLLGTPAQSLRALAAANPAKAADALVAGSVAAPAVRELGANLMLPGGDDDALARGRVAVTPLELASLWTALASDGVARQPQRIRTIAGAAESQAVKAALPAMPPAVAWLTTSLLPTAAARGKALAGQTATDARGAWFAAATADRVVVVRVDGEGGAHASAAARAANAIGLDALTAAEKGLAARPFARPAALVARHVAPDGKILPSTATQGPEEWFLPGSLPKEDPQLPPE